MRLVLAPAGALGVPGAACSSPGMAYHAPAILWACRLVCTASQYSNASTK